MSGQRQFELHPGELGLNESADDVLLPWQQDDPPPADPPFAISGPDGTVWARISGIGDALERVEGPAEAEFAFRVLQRRFSFDVAMLTRRDDVLVNGLKALKLTLLGVKDSIRLAPGQLYYLTERVSPYVGPALEEHVGKRCPFCRLPIDAETHVATCPCGAVYNAETAESHPDLPEEDRLNCVSKVATCLACGNELNLTEHLTWDPSDL